MPSFYQRMNVLLDSLEAVLMGLEVAAGRMLEAAHYAQKGVAERDDSFFLSGRSRAVKMPLLRMENRINLPASITVRNIKHIYILKRW
jgi:hypothetical protein